MIGELVASTAAGARLVELAEKHAVDFAERAGQYDRDNSFVADNVVEMRRSGFFGAAAPRRLGGLGVTAVADLAVAVSRLARGCAATAIVANMHLGSIWVMARTWRRPADDTPQHRALTALLRLASRGRLVVAHAATEPGASLAQPTTTARPVPDGYRLDGRKTFVTNSEVADVLIVFLRIVDRSGVDRHGTAVVRRDTPGLRVRHSWDALGMRGSGSHELLLEGCVVPRDAVRVGDPVGRLGVDAWTGLLGVNFPLAATYLGVAEAAHAEATAAIRTGLSKRSGAPRTADPVLRAHVAESEVDLAVARALLARAGATIDEQLDRDDGDGGLAEADAYALVRDFQVAKLVINRVAGTVVDRAMTMVGGQAYLQRNPLSRYFRDARAGGFMQPFAPDEARDFIGRVCLGLEPYRRLNRGGWATPSGPPSRGGSLRCVSSRTDDEIRHRVRALVLEMAPDPSYGAEGARLVEDLGYHSLALLELAFAIEDEFDVPPIDEASVERIRTSTDIEDYVLENLPSAASVGTED